MSIKITADRMIDLPKEDLEEYNIDTISCYVNMGGKSYSDLDDVFPADVFRYMEETGKVAQTAAKSPTLYAEFFKPFVDIGDTVIHFAVSSGISSIANNAKSAAEEFPGKVFIIDTLLLSNGIALLVRYAMSLIAAGETNAEIIVSKVLQKIPKVQGSFLLNTLDCLYKGGRCSGLTYYAANLLKIRPVIYMNETGHMVVREKHRGHTDKTLESYVKTTFEKYPNPDLNLLYIVYSTYDKDMLERVKSIVGKYHTFEKTQENFTGCNCAIHCGKETIALFYMCK